MISLPQAHIIRKPLVTEKSTLQSEIGFYTFEVDKKATKTQIKTAVELFFDVKVQSVNTMICRKETRRTKLGLGKVRYWKKAQIKLKPGHKIALFEGA